MIDLTAESSSEDSLITGPPLEIVEAPGSATQIAAQLNDSPQTTIMPLTTATAPTSSKEILRRLLNRHLNRGHKRQGMVNTKRFRALLAQNLLKSLIKRGLIQPGLQDVPRNVTKSRVSVKSVTKSESTEPLPQTPAL